jgi:hypothetical protein
MTDAYYSKIILIILIAIMITAGCSTISSHDKYVQVTVTEKFVKSQPMAFVDQSLVSNEAFYYHDYYIRYITGGMSKADRVSKDTYTSVFEGNTYVLKWGYIDDFDSDNKDYGFTSVIKKVGSP